MGQTFADIAGYRGTYVTNPLNINIDADGSINTINWVDTVPSNTTFRLESSIQINDGSDYTPWKQVFKNGSIPDIGSHTNMRNLKIKFRAIFNTLDFVNTPKLTSISMNFTPVIEFNNIGDIEATPEIWITKTGNGDFSLINTSNNNEVFKFTGLIDGETVYVNNYNQQIETTIPGYYRYGNFNDNFLNIPVGINVFKVQGSAKIQFRSEFKVLA